MNDILDELKEGVEWRHAGPSEQRWMVNDSDAVPDLNTTNGELPSGEVWGTFGEATYSCLVRIIEGRDIEVVI